MLYSLVNIPRILQQKMAASLLLMDPWYYNATKIVTKLHIFLHKFNYVYINLAEQSVV